MKNNNTLENKDNELIDNERDIKINKKNEKKYFKINEISNKENESLNSNTNINNNKIDFIFEYDGKEIEELSD